MKKRCAVCGNEIHGEFAEVLRVGPQGYRKYPVCMKHAPENSIHARVERLQKDARHVERQSKKVLQEAEAA